LALASRVRPGPIVLGLASFTITSNHAGERRTFATLRSCADLSAAARPPALTGGADDGTVADVVPVSHCPPTADVVALATGRDAANLDDILSATV